MPLALCDMAIGLHAEGWYKDPYGQHSDRWFSGGRATNLVRDSGGTSYDAPPDHPFDGPLVPCAEVDEQDETVRADDDYPPESPFTADPISPMG